MQEHKELLELLFSLTPEELALSITLFESGRTPRSPGTASPLLPTGT